MAFRYEKMWAKRTAALGTFKKIRSHLFFHTENLGFVLFRNVSNWSSFYILFLRSYALQFLRTRTRNLISEMRETKRIKHRHKEQKHLDTIASAEVQNPVRPALSWSWQTVCPFSQSRVKSKPRENSHLNENQMIS